MQHIQVKNFMSANLIYFEAKRLNLEQVIKCVLNNFEQYTSHKMVIFFTTILEIENIY